MTSSSLGPEQANGLKKGVDLLIEDRVKIREMVLSIPIRVVLFVHALLPCFPLRVVGNGPIVGYFLKMPVDEE